MRTLNTETGNILQRVRPSKLVSSIQPVFGFINVLILSFFLFYLDILDKQCNKKGGPNKKIALISRSSICLIVENMSMIDKKIKYKLTKF